MRTISVVLDKRPVGGDFVHQIQVRDDEGVLISDPTMTLESEDPDGVVVSYAVADPEFLATAATGVYNIDIAVTVVGDWFFTVKPSDGNWYIMYVPVGE